MSNLLKEAIVDAQALKEAALKNAEAAIIDKYSDEVKQTIENLLEQDELGAVQDTFAPDMGADMGMDPAMDPGMDVDPEAPVEEVTEDHIPLAATDNLADHEGKNLEETPEEGEEVEFNVNLGALQEAIEELKGELEESEEVEITEEDLAAVLSGDDDVLEEDDAGKVAREEAEFEKSGAGGEQPATDPAKTDPSTGYAAQAQLAQTTEKENDPDAPTGKEPTTEDQDVPEDLVDAVMERLTVDMRASLSGWAGRSSESTKYEMERGLAARRSTDYVEDILEPLKKAQQELTFENKQLKQQALQYRQALVELKETLVETNLSNGRLLYMNRVLRNTSLNERQKETIVEAISNAGSVTEAKTIYDTLQSTVQVTPKRSPQSLSEAITRRSSVIRASRQESTATDPKMDRMQKLAGIK